MWTEREGTDWLGGNMEPAKFKESRRMAPNHLIVHFHWSLADFESCEGARKVKLWILENCQ